MKAIAEIAKTTSIVQKENTDINRHKKSSWTYRPLMLIPTQIHRVWQRASITGYNKNIQMKSIRFSK